MQPRLLVLCLAVSASCAHVPPSSSDGPPPISGPDSISFPPQRRIGRLRLVVPPMVYRDTASIRLESPPQSEPPADGVLSLRGSGGRGLELPVSFPPAPEPEGEPEEDAPPPQHLFTATIEADLVGWPDGPGDAEFRPEDDGPILRARFEIVRRQVARIVPEHRPEIEVWLDDHNLQRPIWGHLPTWANLPNALARPEAPYDGLRGFMLRSYENPQLGRRQPYTVYVPHTLDLDAADGVPMLILLHGSGGDYRNLVADRASGQQFEEHPMLIANAGAFYHQEFRHLALNDILWIIEDMAAKYPVDRRRIYLQGISLGGRGTLEVAALLPGTFAALSAHGVYGLNFRLMDPGDILQMEGAGAGLAALADIRTVLPSLHRTPAEIVMGWRDEATPPGQALVIEALIRQAGGEVRLTALDTGHNMTLPYYDWADTRAWMLEHRLPEEPPLAVRHRVVNLRFGRSAWVRVTEFQDSSRPGDVLARLDPEAGELSVMAWNVGRLDLDPPHPVTRLTVNGRPDPLPLRPGRIRLERQTDGTFLRVPADEPDAAGRKRPGVSGPIWDAWSTPVVYLHPDDDRLAESARRSAEIDIAFGDPSLPVAGPAEADAFLRTHSLVIFTSKQTPHPLLDGLELPDLATADLPGEADLAIFIHPSPWAEDRYLVVVRSEGDRPVRLHELGHWDAAFFADWLLAQSRSDEETGRPQMARLLAAGVFDARWRPAASTPSDFRGLRVFGRPPRRRE